MSRRVSLGLAFAVTLLAGSLGCGPTAGTGAGTVSPGGAHDGELQGEGRQEGESADELELRLRRLVSEQESLIVPANSEAGTCEDLCSLATSICGIKEKLCNIADRHPTDPSYTQLCREAKQECRESQDSCIRCVERHASPSDGADAEPAAAPREEAVEEASPPGSAPEEPAAAPG
jgi:hypothetical protein